MDEQSERDKLLAMGLTNEVVDIVIAKKKELELKKQNSIVIEQPQPIPQPIPQQEIPKLEQSIIPKLEQQEKQIEIVEPEISTHEHKEEIKINNRKYIMPWIAFRFKNKK